jgi:hypothetical protein
MSNLALPPQSRKKRRRKHRSAFDGNQFAGQPVEMLKNERRKCSHVGRPFPFWDWPR